MRERADAVTYLRCRFELQGLRLAHHLGLVFGQQFLRLAGKETRGIAHIARVILL